MKTLAIKLQEVLLWSAYLMLGSVIVAITTLAIKVYWSMAVMIWSLW